MQLERLGVRAQLLVLAVVILLLHVPSLWAGRLLDDIVVLDRCEHDSWSGLFRDGFRFQRSELGDVWWMEQETILHYFRPLVLASLRVVGVVSGWADWAQHAFNILLHGLTAVLLLFVARFLFHSPRSAFLATLFFTTSIHHWWAVLLITARKELLAGVLILLAFYLHVRRRWWLAGLSFAGALLSGEHAATFPMLILIWAVAAPGSAQDASPSGRPLLHQLGICTVYFAILGAYVAIRTRVLGGLPLPAPPYFTHPLAEGAAAYLLFKPLVLLFCLTTTVPFVDRLIIQIWLNHLLLGLAFCTVTTVLILGAVAAAARQRRLGLVLLGLAVCAYLPFWPMVGLPFYLYTPMMFYALAVGAGLDGESLGPPAGQILVRRCLRVVVGLGVVVNFGIGVFLAWGPSLGPFGPGVDSPQKLARAVQALLEDEPPDRKVIFVDVPSPPPFFYFIDLLQRDSGRDFADLAVVTGRPRRESGDEGKVTRDGPLSFRVESPDQPYYSKPLKKLQWFFPEGLIAEGRTFDRPWLRVTIEGVGDWPEPGDRGPRFFSTEPGITALRIDVKPGVDPPLVIGFEDDQPFVLFDMAEPADPAGGAE